MRIILALLMVFVFEVCHAGPQITKKTRKMITPAIVPMPPVIIPKVFIERPVYIEQPILMELPKRK